MEVREEKIEVLGKNRQAVSTRTEAGMGQHKAVGRQRRRIGTRGVG